MHDIIGQLESKRAAARLGGGAKAKQKQKNPLIHALYSRNPISLAPA